MKSQYIIIINIYRYIYIYFHCLIESDFHCSLFDSIEIELVRVTEGDSGTEFDPSDGDTLLQDLSFCERKMLVYIEAKMNPIVDDRRKQISDKDGTTTKSEQV